MYLSFTPPHSIYEDILKNEHGTPLTYRMEQPYWGISQNIFHKRKLEQREGKLMMTDLGIPFLIYSTSRGSKP